MEECVSPVLCIVMLFACQGHSVEFVALVELLS